MQLRYLSSCYMRDKKSKDFPQDGQVSLDTGSCRADYFKSRV